MPFSLPHPLKLFVTVGLLICPCPLPGDMHKFAVGQISSKQESPKNVFSVF
jgi:hypothetical protein